MTKPNSVNGSISVQPFDDFVSASLLLDEWLVWMSSLCGQNVGTEVPFFVRSRVPRLQIVPRLVPPPDEEIVDQIIAYGLSFFSGWHEPVRIAVSTWSHLLIASSGSAGAVRSSLLRIADGSTGAQDVWRGFPESVVDPSAHEAVLGWFTEFADRVQNLGLPALSGSDNDMFRDIRSWPADSHLESHFENWSWNRNDGARLAALMEGERRILYQAWKKQGEAESLPDYHQLWKRDRHVSLAAIDVITKLGLMDRSILKNLSIKQPCKKEPLCHFVCGDKPHAPGNFNKSLAKIQILDLMCAGDGQLSPGYSLTDFGNEVAMALNGMEPTTSSRHSEHG